MRVSKLFWVKGPEPEPIRLLNKVLLCGAGNAPRIFPAAGEIRPIGIMLLAKAVRLAPVLGSPVLGSKTTPAVPAGPATPDPGAEYWLRSQKPGVGLVGLVAGLQVDKTSAVGTVKVPLTPLVWRVPW